MNQHMMLFVKKKYKSRSLKPRKHTRKGNQHKKRTTKKGIRQLTKIRKQPQHNSSTLQRHILSIPILQTSRQDSLSRNQIQNPRKQQKPRKT